MSYDVPRNHYRVLYPVAVRPVFTTGATEYRVVDLSEGGMRCALGDLPHPELGTMMEGTIKFKRGHQRTLRGEVVRLGVGFMALRLDVGVPFAVMIDEQRYLLNRSRRMT